MTPKIRALSVHLLTATGAVFAMLAMLAAVDAKWDLMFLWLVVAFFVDGIMGHWRVTTMSKRTPLNLMVCYLI